VERSPKDRQDEVIDPCFSKEMGAAFESSVRALNPFANCRYNRHTVELWAAVTL